MAKLVRSLSYRAILLITINSIVGTGIFFLPAVGAREAGPASIISWIILAIISIYISMCFGELSSMFPKSGGVYEFCKHAYGRFFSFIIGWLTLIVGNITIAMLVIGAIQYLIPFSAPQITIPISILFLLIFNYIAYRGMKTSSVMLVTFAIITLTAVFGLIIPGLFKFSISNLTPFFVKPNYMIYVTIFIVAETFFGWETATFLAGETKEGEKVMPKVFIISTIFIAIFCILAVLTTIGVIPWNIIGASKAPLTDLAILHYGNIGKYIFTILVYLAIIGSVAGWIVSAPRLILSMAEDRLFLKQLAAVHPKHKSPYKAIIFQFILTTILVVIGAGSYETLLHMLLPMALVMYSFVLLALVILRFKYPNKKRYYTTPLGISGPIIVVLFLISLVTIWAIKTEGALNMIKLGLSFILLGLPIYLLLEMYYDTKAIRRAHNYLAYFSLLFEHFTHPKIIKKKTLELLGDIKNKKILEYGCGVGSFTIDLADAVTSKGKIYATDICEKGIALAKKRADKRNHKHVIHIHDPNHHDRIHPDIPKIDNIVSIGILGYIPNVEKVLKQMNKKLNKGSKVVFVDYDKFFEFIPNTEWLGNDKKIRQKFSLAGFDIEIKRERGIAWRYIFIIGKKVKSV